MPILRSFPDPAEIGGNPVPHQLALSLENRGNPEGLAHILVSYLSTEPYILRNPAPKLDLVEGELLLQFFALPNLSKAEHALLDATVQRLRPNATSPDRALPQSGDAGAA